MLKKDTQARTGETLQDVIETLAQLGVSYDQDMDLQSRDLGIASGNYKIIDGVLWFNNGLFGSGEELLNVRVLAIAPESSLGKTTGEIQLAEEAFAKRISAIKTQLAQDLDADIEEATELSNSWLTLQELQKAIPNFDPLADDVIQSYEGENGVHYVLVINDKKAANEDAYAFFKAE